MRRNRKNERALISLVARYRSPTAFEFVQEECYDLSVGGMFIKSEQPAPPGTLLKLECDVDGGQQVIRAVARVVWQREQEDNGEPAGMGVKFVKVEAGGREVIDGLVERSGPRESLPPPEAQGAAERPSLFASTLRGMSTMPSAPPRSSIADQLPGKPPPPAPSRKPPALPPANTGQAQPMRVLQIPATTLRPPGSRCIT